MLYTENALAQQACVLRSDLEKSLQDNASLFMKIGMHSLLYTYIFRVPNSVRLFN